MVYSVYPESYPNIRRTSARFLAFSFLIGFVCGLYAGLQMDEALFPLMCGMVVDSVSIVRLIGMLLIPFVISTSAFWIDPAFLFPICFVRAFLFAFVHLCLLGYYGESGYVLRWLLLISDSLCLPVLYFFWHRIFSGHPLNIAKLLAVYTLVCGIGFFDFYTVAPLWAKLQILQKG